MKTYRLITLSIFVCLFALYSQSATAVPPPPPAESSHTDLTCPTEAPARLISCSYNVTMKTIDCVDASGGFEKPFFVIGFPGATADFTFDIKGISRSAFALMVNSNADGDTTKITPDDVDHFILDGQTLTLYLLQEEADIDFLIARIAAYEKFLSEASLSDGLYGACVPDLSEYPIQIDPASAD
ncbi:MAG TPA: hypothetical protein VJC18_09150, partial [bacterium]|nr:hypothetical protein [bacterium]